MLQEKDEHLRPSLKVIMKTSAAEKKPEANKVKLLGSETLC